MCWSFKAHLHTYFSCWNYMWPCHKNIVLLVGSWEKMCTVFYIFKYKRSFLLVLSSGINCLPIRNDHNLKPVSWLCQSLNQKKGFASHCLCELCCRHPSDQGSFWYPMWYTNPPDKMAKLHELICSTWAVLSSHSCHWHVKESILNHAAHFNQLNLRMSSTRHPAAHIRLLLLVDLLISHFQKKVNFFLFQFIVSPLNILKQSVMHAKLVKTTIRELKMARLCNQFCLNKQ